MKKGGTYCLLFLKNKFELGFPVQDYFNGFIFVLKKT